MVDFWDSGWAFLLFVPVFMVFGAIIWEYWQRG